MFVSRILVLILFSVALCMCQEEKSPLRNPLVTLKDSFASFVRKLSQLRKLQPDVEQPPRRRHTVGFEEESRLEERASPREQPCEKVGNLVPLEANFVPFYSPKYLLKIFAFPHRMCACTKTVSQARHKHSLLPLLCSNFDYNNKNCR